MRFQEERKNIDIQNLEATILNTTILTSHNEIMNQNNLASDIHSLNKPTHNLKLTEFYNTAISVKLSHYSNTKHSGLSYLQSLSTSGKF